ncbi:fungal-specific transcription factor domain-containing protein [Entophlyctis helioformis]|nr:fungal-specific transcription factor domain-containing protein [Entophlyctis helioformis]
MPSDEHRKPPPERKKVRQACDQCIRRRCKCDSERPVCEPCRRTDRVCTWTTVQRKRGPRPGTTGSHAAAAAAAPAAAAAASSTSPPPTSSSRTAAPNVAHVLPTEPALFPPPMPPAFDAVGSGAAYAQHHGSPGSGSGTGSGSGSGANDAYDASQALQRSPVRLDLINVFFQFFHPFFPVIHKERFIANLDSAHPLILNAVYAVATPYFDHLFRIDPSSKQTLFASGDPYYYIARSLVNEYLDEPDTYTVAALVILAAHSCMTGRQSANWQLLGMAIRTAHQLDLHIDPSILGRFPDKNEREERRALFWVCYELDCYSACMAGMPTYIHEGDYSVRLPEYSDPDQTGTGYAETIAFIGDGMGPQRNATNAQGHFIHLLRIYSSIMRFTRQWLENNLMDPRIPPNGDQQTQLEAKLHDWFFSLPPWMRAYSIPTEQGKTPHSAQFYRVYIHIVYHTSVIRLHLPSIIHHLSSGSTANLRTNTSLNAATQSANAMTSILKEMAFHNPFFQFMAPFVAYCLSLGGMVHALLQQHQHVDTHISALSTMSRFVFMGKQDAVILSSLKLMTTDGCVRTIRNRLKASLVIGRICGSARTQPSPPSSASASAQPCDQQYRNGVLVTDAILAAAAAAAMSTTNTANTANTANTNANTGMSILGMPFTMSSLSPASHSDHTSPGSFLSSSASGTSPFVSQLSPGPGPAISGFAMNGRPIPPSALPGFNPTVALGSSMSSLTIDQLAGMIHVNMPAPMPSAGIDAGQLPMTVSSLPDSDMQDAASTPSNGVLVMNESMSPFEAMLTQSQEDGTALRVKAETA